MPYQTECPECGLMHPIVAPGECTVAAAQQMDNSAEHLRSQKAIKMQQAIQIKLLTRLKELSAEQQEELSHMVYVLIDRYD